MNTDEKFIKCKQLGDKGEAFVLGFIAANGHPDFQGKLYHISQYNPASYRRNNKQLPDFVLETPEKKVKYFEVKAKFGLGDSLNINTRSVQNYISIANEDNAEIHLLFVCIEDGKVYWLDKQALKRYSDKKYNERDKSSFYTYRKSDQKVLLENIPSIIFKYKD